jgi:hypothetical protein
MPAIATARDQFEQTGYVIRPGLFSPEEVSFFRSYFTDMRDRGGDGWAEGGVDFESEDPLRAYPRLLQPHRGDQVAMDFMLDPRLQPILTEICGETPYAVQTMVYFKSPGSRGQALHQDQRYLRCEPGTCMAAWLALDDCDEENGCMYVVPGSHNLPMICPDVADPEESWGGDYIPPPLGLAAVPAIMKAGDVLFFNGSLIHGSGKNRSATRFRRTLIAHYIAAECDKVAHYYFPVYRFDGSTVDEGLSANPWGGGPCGVPRIVDGETVYEMVGSIEEARAAH